ncbi:hypothetical protein KPSA1_07595 [Pseudomonas syringae pv. actinidiae]|uniref:Uncharacterized protein n=1 Tax=Pseudomonas syringae pv. actinidiae TaxID=103796 RepID=A0A2V0QLV7_PSESF|nr:hypothetical protein KPSA1_07595 [Pseudomonas syringae pv. actinidiae]
MKLSQSIRNISSLFRMIMDSFFHEIMNSYYLCLVLYSS